MGTVIGQAPSIVNGIYVSLESVSVRVLNTVSRRYGAGEKVSAKTSRSFLKVLVEFLPTRWRSNPTYSTNSDRSGSGGADIELLRCLRFVPHTW